MSDLLLLPEGWETEYRRCGGVFLLIVQTYLNIVLNRQIGEQTDILEGTGDTHAVYLRGILSRGVDAVEQDGSVCRLIHLCEQVEKRWSFLRRSVR